MPDDLKPEDLELEGPEADERQSDDRASAGREPADQTLYPPLARKMHDAESERRINRFWKEHDTFRRSIQQREGAPDFVFYEGPPTANGKPGVHHVISRVCKDIVCRYKTMTGHRVLRKAGWDTHGLPVERSVEKELGIQGAQAIREYGLEQFNARARTSVWTCKQDWDDFTELLGYWVDLDDPYITYTDDYIETVWWILARFHAEGLLYRGHKVVPFCPVCSTPLSSHEMANSYRTVSDPSIYVKLAATEPGPHGPESFVTWTTTPWTLPSNVALAVGPDFDYVRVRRGGGGAGGGEGGGADGGAGDGAGGGVSEVLILAEARLEAALGTDEPLEILERLKGRDLLGRRYRQLFPFCRPDEGRRAFEVVAGDFVTLDTGSGIVHMAPAFGEDDFAVGERENLAFFEPVDPNGAFTAEVPPYEGLHVKKADPRIVRDLREQGHLLREATHTHEYPYHDRCGNPLIYYATPSWFIRTTALRDRLLEANRHIRWVPPEVGTGRFGNWLEGNVDWSLSRNRFWGTPLNVWTCDACEQLHLPTCRADLTDLTGTDQSRLDLHRPHVDSVTFPCVHEGCSGTMRRTPEVIDCWFDSGSMPFAQYHYPFENRELFESQFPADFISEGVDQTRGWFYTMLVISTFLFGRSSYRSCLVNELILDKKGKKMSKSVGNTVNPVEIMAKGGADPLRWYMVTASPVWTPLKFDDDGVAEAQRKLLATLENTYAFFALYANIDGFRPGEDGPAEPDLLDRWIVSRLQTVTASVRTDLEDLNLTRAGKTLGAFVLDDVSNWYVRLARRRFWHGEMTADKRSAFRTLHTVLESTVRLLAPFVPFTAEEIFRGLRAHADGDASVHLADYPAAAASLQDADLERAMAVAQDVVGVGRSLRQDARLRTRQPLGRLLLHAEDDRVERLLADGRLVGYVASELNVKDVAAVSDPADVARITAKANYRALGPRFGKGAPAAARRIEAMTPDEIAGLRRAGRITLRVDGEPVEFGFEEIQVRQEGIAPCVAAGHAGLTVALDTSLSDELLAEGMAREIINRVQNLRKKSGLEVSDRIVLNVHGGEPVQQVLARHGERIAAETLAVRLAEDGSLPHVDAFEIDGTEVRIALGRA
ncbi:MAG: isoleucine--tRNA ligase [Candidatus Krumholzibacteriia bacterium]